jgi:peptide/nickel transport system permease protein
MPDPQPDVRRPEDPRAGDPPTEGLTTTTASDEAPGLVVADAGLAQPSEVQVPPAVKVEVAKTKRLGIAGWVAIGWLALAVLLAVLAPILPIKDPQESFSCARMGPVAGHPLGCDGNGRDMLSRVIWGARASLTVGTASVVMGLVIGGFLGLVAGYFRRKLETVLVALFDVFLAFPQLVLALALVSVLATGKNVTGSRREMVLILALGIVSIPILGRITRANTLAWSQREFVLAGRALGARNRRIIAREVLPNVMPAMFSIALLGIAVVIVAEGGLSLLGVGVALPTPSWGNIIAEGRSNLRDAPYIVFIPSAAIFLTVLSLNYLGDVVRARFDVRESAL